MVMAVAWAKGRNLLDQNVKWYQEKWKRGHVLENSQAKLLWDSEFILRKTTTSSGSYLMFEENQAKTIWIRQRRPAVSHKIFETNTSFYVK